MSLRTYIGVHGVESGDEHHFPLLYSQLGRGATSVSVDHSKRF